MSKACDVDVLTATRLIRFRGMALPTGSRNSTPPRPMSPLSTPIGTANPNAPGRLYEAAITAGSPGHLAFDRAHEMTVAGALLQARTHRGPRHAYVPEVAQRASDAHLLKITVFGDNRSRHTAPNEPGAADVHSGADRIVVATRQSASP
jgi:hypothetical protein